MTREVEHLAVVGAGLIGGSVAAAARRAGVARVVLTDADPGVRARARACGLAHEVVDDLTAAVANVDLVLAAVPSAAVPDVLEAAAEACRPDTLLTDAASLKRDSTLDVESRLRDTARGAARFVGGHPMAGSERSGPEAADATLFQGATWVLTPTPATADATLEAVRRFVVRLGARVVALPPARHDELVAVVSHLPHVVASTLADVAGEAADAAGAAMLAIAGGGFRDTTRIAAGEPDLWVGILEGNRAAVLEAVDAYATRLATVREALAAGDTAAVRAWLQRGATARGRLVPKAVQAPQVDVVVPLDDRPGQLARATTVLGAAGVNVEDLAMRHALDGRRGALLLRVAVDEAPAAVDALRAEGLEAHVDAEDRGIASDPDTPAQRPDVDRSTGR